MQWLVIPIEELKEFDKDWESRRTNIDGTEALIHEEIFNEYFPPVMLLSETDEDTTAEQLIAAGYELQDFKESTITSQYVKNSLIIIRQIYSQLQQEMELVLQLLMSGLELPSMVSRHYQILQLHQS